MSEQTTHDLDGPPMSIDAEDFELYRAMLALNVAIYEARIYLTAHGKKAEMMKRHMTTIGAIYEIVKTLMGDSPSSTGSRRDRVRDHLHERLLRGDPGPACDVGCDQRQDPAEYPGVGFTKSQRQGTGPRFRSCSGS